MKKFAGLVVILAALLLGSYYGMGYITEKKVKEDLNVVNQSNGISATVTQYKRGWFTSEALLDWKFHVPERVVQSPDGQSQTIPSEDFQWQMPVTIYHGPIIFSDKGIKFGFGYAHSKLPLPPQYSDKFNEIFSSESTQPKLDLSFFVNYLTNSTIDMTVPAFKLVTKQGNSQLDWLGLTTTTNVSSSLDKVDGNITLDGLVFTKNQLKTITSAITSEYNLHKNSLGLYLGDASLSFPSLVIMNNDKKLFELTQFNIHSDTNIEDGLFNSHFKSSIEKVVAQDKNFGPGNIEIAIRNLDAQVLADINTRINQVQQSSDFERQKTMLALIPELPKLFGKGAEFEISEMNLVVPEGTIEGNLMVSLPKGDTANPFELIQKIQGKGQIKVPTLILRKILTESMKQKASAPQTIQQGIVQQMQQQTGSEASVKEAAPTTTPANPSAAPSTGTAPSTDLAVLQQAQESADKQLAAMIQSGLLTVQGSDYVLEVNLNQGQFVINGKPFNPAMMKF